MAMGAESIVWSIKPLFSADRWDIKDESKLADWIHEKGYLWGDEWIYAARELIQDNGLDIGAREFFAKGARQAGFLDKNYWKPETDMEIILRVFPEFLDSELYNQIYGVSK